MKILITGGFGYVGGRLAQSLQSAGHDVILGSRIQRSVPDWLAAGRVLGIEWDFAESLDAACHGVDAVVHAAGLNAQESESDPVAALAVNGLTTGRLLQAAIRQGVSRFIYLSTAHVYASPLVGRIDENRCPASLHPYATSHRAGEDFVRRAHERGDIDGVVVRLSNAFGAPTHKEVNCWTLLVNDLCRQAVQNRKLILRTSGVQQRDFIAMRNVAESIGHLLEMPDSSIGDGVFNLGEQAMSVLEMTQRIAVRCEIVLGVSPALVRAQPVPGEIHTSIEYVSEKLRKTGLSLSDRINEELDATLYMCAQAWR